jgi:hypothetical protein
MLLVGAISDGLIEAAMLGLRQPVGAIGHLVFGKGCMRGQKRKPKGRRQQIFFHDIQHFVSSLFVPHASSSVSKRQLNACNAR